MDRYGVIDLGTNTFHLLIVELEEDTTFKLIHRERVFVKLAEQGIETIASAPFERGITALQHFNNILTEYQVKNVKAFGTAALRTASNAAHFIAEIKAVTGINVAIIPGEEEARLIYQGVRQIVSFGKENGLIMDIGGGSVEFILANHEGVIWSASFPLGVAVLTRNFHKSDPIAPTEIDSLLAHLENTLQPLHQILKKHKVSNLIGASGTFDVLETILGDENNNALTSSFPSEKFSPLHDSLLQTTVKERLAMNDIPDSRAEMIITALILIQYILELSHAPKITVSSYAMKEGMLQEMIDVKS